MLERPGSGVEGSRLMYTDKGKRPQEEIKLKSSSIKRKDKEKE